MINYNNAIKKLRTSAKYNTRSIDFFLQKPAHLNEYQSDLAYELSSNPSVDTITDLIDESVESENYEKNIQRTMEK